ncbi:MAG: Fe-S cluster assembly protein SufD, partial [Planctomycetota bacterium]
MTTQTAPTSADCFAAAFDRLDARAPVHALRREALDRFQARGLPTRREEDWKYTDVRAIAGTPYVSAAEATIAEGQIAPYRLDRSDADQLVFINGRFAPEWSSVGSLPDGARVGSLAEALATDFARIEPHLGQIVHADDHPFTALNTALLGDGLLVRLPADTALPRPVHVLYMTVPGAAPTMSHPRNLIVAGAGSRATIIETYASAGDGAYLTTAVTEVLAESSAAIDHYKVELESEQASHVGSLHVRQEASSTVTSHNFSVGGALIRNDLYAALDAEGCHSTYNGLSLTRGDQHVDNHLWIDHLKPNCNSWEFYKSILDDRSSGVFSGRIYVAPDAQKTDAKQTSMNLLLTNDAHADTKPQLEIFADDVKCTHGATIGQLHDDHLFYLQARGIGLDAARSLLIYAFGNEVISEVQV